MSSWLARSYSSLSRRFRRRRQAVFQTIFPITPSTRVLDVGGTIDIWRLSDLRPSLVIVNNVFEAGASREVPEAVANGCLLPFADAAFDIVFSNSVIEHVGTVEDQARFAFEVARVGRGYYVQTPCWNPFIDPHLLMPFIHLLPHPILRRLFRHFTLMGRRFGSSQEQIDHYLAITRILTVRDMTLLFPDAEILRERFFGITKSILAYRLPRPVVDAD